MSAKVITITREFGSGGRTIGRKVAEALGYSFYDWNLVEKIATETGFAKEFIEENGEEQGRFSAVFTSSSFGFNLNEQLFEAQSRVVLKLAEQGNCVIVGRCADYLLRNDPNTISCFIYANNEARKNRIINEYGETDVPIEKRLKDKDKRRKSHYEYFTSRKWGKSFYYDLCIDTGRIPIDTAVNLIVEAAKGYQPGLRNTDGD
ncbi:MAG: cytidylate kinase-like family protein [Erysipelotrichaceae bacterium]|nr:cytidylate kinase-like family protein [Erysipelotrichaceae bacterium]